MTLLKWIVLITAFWIAPAMHGNALENTGRPSGSEKPGDRPASVSRKYGPLNVQAFGAKGDGITDDTDAIQRCILQAASADYPKLFYKAFAAAPEVFFPKGTYLVSRTLLVPVCGGSSGYGLIAFRGEDATIKQVHPELDILYFRLAFRILVEGLTFDGGKRQIKLWSRNLDSAHIIIRDCTFRNSSGYAIDDQIRKGKKTENPYDNLSDMIEPYGISTNAQGLPVLAPIDESRLPHFPFVSTCMRINRCSFQQCMGLSLWADWALMDDCTIETHPDMSGPYILSGGHLLLENVTGLAHVSPGKDQYWIEKVADGQEDGIDLKNVRLKTDAKDGWCLVRNKYKFSGGRHVQIIADGCEFQSTGSRENCLIHLSEVPNLINVRNCRETSGRKVNILGFEKPLEEDDFHFHSPEVFSYVINENNRDLVPNLPEAMEPFADVPLPEKIARRFDQEPTPVTLPRMRADVAKQINLMDFGAKGDGSTDDSGAFRKAFAAIGKESSLVEVLVPNGLYRMDQTVELPQRVVVRGSGHAALTTPSGKKGAIFTGPDAEHLVFQNLHFFKCAQAIAITTKANRKSNILIDNCFFSANDDFAITCLSGTGAVAEPNKTTLRVSDCTFTYSQALHHNARYALMDNAWITTDPDMANSAAILNKGMLHLKSLCGVPQVTRIHKTGGQDKTDTRADDLRWIDNYYQVICDRCRFGGEDGGLPMVVNFASKGYVLLQNSWIGIYKGNPKRITIVDCEEIPELIALRGNMGWPSPPMMVTVRAGAKGVLKGRWFESGNTAAPWVRDERNAEKNNAEKK